ncbi:MAG: branched-chain amino acid ABC transporter permease [Candidatus Geothermarchaeales archaeon]
MNRTIQLGVVVFIIATVVPLMMLGTTYWIHILIISLYYVVLASSWNLVSGYAGQFSFGHVALAAVGGYSSSAFSIFFGISPFLTIPVGGLMAAGAGYVVGRATLKMRGPYLALTTIAFSESLRIVISNYYDVITFDPDPNRAFDEILFTGGALGLDTPFLFGGSAYLANYYSMLGLAAVSILAIYWLTKSRVGLFLRSIREDEEAAAASGVDVVRYKVLAFVISSFFAGIAGAFYGHYLGLLTPDMMVLGEMGLVIAMTVIGGMGSIVGPVLGAVLVQISSEYMRVVYPDPVTAPIWRFVFFGLLVIVMARFARNGIVGIIQDRIRKLRPSVAPTSLP